MSADREEVHDRNAFAVDRKDEGNSITRNSFACLGVHVKDKEENDDVAPTMASCILSAMAKIPYGLEKIPSCTDCRSGGTCPNRSWSLRGRTASGYLHAIRS